MTVDGIWPVCPSCRDDHTVSFTVSVDRRFLTCSTCRSEWEWDEHTVEYVLV